MFFSIFNAMQNSCKYLIVISISVLIILIFGCVALKSGNNNGTESLVSSEKGPVWIKNRLSEAGVFKVPPSELTSEYDKYRQYQNLTGLFFDGLNFHGNPTKVFCWYGVPESLKKGEKAPAVVLVHGGGGTVFPDWVKKWTDRGYVAISIALEGQVPGPADQNSKLEMKHQTTKFSGPYRKGFFLDIIHEELQDQWFYHAVADIILANSLLRSFPEVDMQKIGITGISWGGILTNVVAGIDNRFAFSIPVYGCGYLQEAPTYIKQLSAHSPESKQFYLENWEPSLYMPIQSQPTLFVNGTNDHHFSMNSFTKTFCASGSEKKYLHVEHDMKHGHAPGWEPEEIYSFADYVVKGSVEPLSFKKKDIGNTFYFNGEIDKAVAYYTTDTANWSAEAYDWIESEAEISASDKTITTKLPEEAQYFFVNGITKDDKIYSSLMVKVKK